MQQSADARLHFRDREYLVAAGEVLLDALLRQGADVAHSCGKGSCHTCVLRLESGDVVHDKAVDAGLLASGHVLPCVGRARGDIRLAPPQLDRLAIPGEIVSRRALGDDVHEIAIAPMKSMPFQAGQHVQVVRGGGVSRSYSIASLPDEDYFFLLHVRRVPGGAMSDWLCAQAAPGDRVDLFAPRGDCHYRADMAGRPLLLIATGSGAGALFAVARDALANGHRGPITFHHGARRPDGLYLHAALRGLERAHAGFRYVPSLSGPCDEARRPDGARDGRVTNAAFGPGVDLAEAEVFLCGSPAMVEDARCRAVAAGAARARIHADPFEEGGRKPPRDSAKFAAMPADPELWAALGHGPGLRRVLELFYSRVYVDERLSPFFHGLPIDQVVAKQYAFLADVFSGRRDYFGMKPYNAHHWMVISDDLFDHREAMFEQALRDCGLAEPLIRRWGAMHERFRAEIVKPVARGLVIDGVEQPLRIHETEVMDIDTVCDSCGGEIARGRRARYQHRLGILHCEACAGLA